MIAVTGGAGFIGSNIVRGLNKRGFDDILVIDDLSDGSKHKNLNRLNFYDYIDYEDFTAELNSFDIEVIFHQGACSDTTEPDGRYMMDLNYNYTKNLWRYSMERGIRFLYASSASVYGDGHDGFRESCECEYPLNVYAFSKYQTDRYLRRNWGLVKSQTVGLRYFNVYGPNENHKGKMASVAFHLFNQIKRGEHMKLFEGSENFRRDFIHVDDVVNVNMFFMEHPEISGIFNCGTGKAQSFMDIADAMRSVYPEASLDMIPFPDELKGKYQDFTEADLTNLRKAGYNGSFMNVADGVKDYIEVLETSGGYLI